MTYKTAVEIYDSLDEDSKVKEIYAHFGLAVYYAQVLEQQSINMIAACKQVENKLTMPVDVEALWDEYDLGSRTFGKLINEIKGLYKLSDEDYQELKAVLKLRNYIAHDYFRFNAELFYNESGQKRMIKDFINFQEMAKSMDIKLITYLRIYMDRIGLTDQHIENIMEQTKQTWESKTIDENHKTIIK